MDLSKTRTRRHRLGLTLSAVATVALTLAGSAVTPATDASSSAVTLAPVPLAAVGLPASSATSDAKASVPAAASSTSIFTPRLILPVPVKAPSSGQKAAFAALNALVDTETRFGDAVIAMRVSLDRAQVAAAANAQLSLVRQTNASAEYALAGSRLLGSFPALQATVVRAFVSDKMTLTLTPAQFAAAKAKLLRGLPASFTPLLNEAAAAYQPSTVLEVISLRAAIVDTQPVEQTLANIAPKTLQLPAVLGSSFVTTPEVRLSAALKSYADTILQPVPPSALGGSAAGREPDARFVADGEAGEQAGEALHTVSEGFEGLSAVAKAVGGEAGEGAAETSFEPLGEAVGYAFAFVAFQEANAAFGEGEGAGGEGGEGGEGNGSSDSAASYGEPHEETFSGSGYVFQAAGEFTLVKSTTDDLDIQVREQRFPGAADVALDTAAAMRVGPNIVELAANESGRLQLWINRRAVAYGPRPLAGGGKISVENPDSATVTWPDGTAASVFSGYTGAIAHETITCNTSDEIDVIVKVAPSRAGHLEGLVGDPGEPFDELVGGNGVVYSLDQLAAPWASVQDFDVLYHQFAQSWRITQQSSLFYYPEGTSTASFTDLAFPSKATTVASLKPSTVAAAKRDCKAEGVNNPYLLSDCVYDLGLTGGRAVCMGGAEARVQTATGGPTATALPESSGALLPSTTPPPSGGLPTTTTTRPTTTKTGTPSPGGTGTPVTVGSAPSERPAVAVDASGTAYAVWQQSTTKLSFCKLDGAATSCDPVTLEVPDQATDQFFGPPSVLLEPGHIYVLDVVVGSSDEDGLNEFVSSDGGATFSVVPHAVGFVGNGGAAGAAVELPGGDFGAGYVIPGSNPAFQANSLAAPTDESAANAAPFATLNPQPSSAYTIGNLGGVFGSQLVGSRGVLGVFEALGGKGSSACPSSANDALAYAYAPINASTTPAELSTSPGGSSPWRPLAKVDCDGTDPAVGGGPSGLGLLETNEAHVPNPGPLVQYRRFSPSSGFGSEVTIATDEVGSEGTLSQDSAGHIFATWLDSSTGVDLADSSNGGASWTKPRVLFSNRGNPSGISLLASAVGPSGQGWAVYSVGEREYAQRFSGS